jgi:opacity protein-like surface antigen
VRVLFAAAAFVLVTVSTAGGSVSARLGKDYFHGDLFEGCRSKPPSASLYGVFFHFESFPLVDLDFGGEYSSTDFVLACGGEGYACALKHYSLCAAANVGLIPLEVLKFYGGGGLSYDWFERSGVPGDEGTDSGPGMQFHGGVMSTIHGSFINGYIEVRYRWLGGAPTVNTSSAYLGLKFG